MENDMKKRKRSKKNKKWSLEEIGQILNYLQEAPEVEAPTAQIYYKKFIELSGIDASWELIRWKVRHLKATFNKANEWKKSSGARLLETCEGAYTVEGKVLQICPHYYQLKEIFGKKTGNTSFEEVDVDILNNVEEIKTSSSTEDNPFFYNDESLALLQESYELSTPSVSNVAKKAKDFAEKIKKIDQERSESSAAHLHAFQTERREMWKIKLEWEREKHMKYMLLEERKLNLEEEKLKADIENKKREFQLKELEIQKDERLKILQMEKDERLQRLEIELKYKNNFQK